MARIPLPEDNMLPSLRVLAVTVSVAAAIGPAAAQSQAPRGWAAVAEHVGLDSLVRHSGTFSGWVRGDSASSVSTLRQSFQADSVRGRRVRFRAFVLTKLAQGTAALWMRVDGAGLQEVLAFDNMNERPIIGSTPWTQYEVVLDVPPESSVIVFGLLVEGSGQVWLDDAQLEIVDARVASTNMDDALGQMMAQKMPTLTPDDRSRILAARQRAPRWPVNLGFEQRP